MFIDIIKNRFDYQLLVHGNEQSFSKQGVRGEFPLAKNSIAKTNDEYLRRTITLYNNGLRKLRGTIATKAVLTFWDFRYDIFSVNSTVKGTVHY